MTVAPRTPRSLRASLSALVLLPVGAAALHLQEARAPSSDPLAELAWLAGRWEGETLGGRAEEHWLAPRAGSMAGVFRLTETGAPHVYELLLIEEEEDGVFLRFAHFSPGFRMWEGDPVELRLAECEGERAVFEASAADPGGVRRVTYLVAGGSTLRVEIELEPKEGEEVESFVAVLERAE